MLKTLLAIRLRRYPLLKGRYEMRRFLFSALAATLMLLGFICIIVEVADAKLGQLGKGARLEIARFYAELRPMSGAELIDIGNAANKPKALQVKNFGAVPRISGAADDRLASLTWEEGVSGRAGRIVAWRGLHGIRCKARSHLASYFPQGADLFPIRCEPSAWEDLDSRPLAKVSDIVVGLDNEFGTRLEDVDDQIAVQPNPRTLVGLQLVQGSIRDEPSRYADARGDGGQDRNRYCGPSRREGRPILGGLFLLIGLPPFILALNILDGSWNPVIFSLAGWSGALVGGFFIFQGTLLALSGDWIIRLWGC
jgi:hypothetical protein